MNKKWRTVGWWTISGKTSEYLTFSNGNYVKTNSSVFFYFAESLNGDLYWGNGDFDGVVNGREVPMTKLEDKTGDSEWTIAWDEN